MAAATSWLPHGPLRGHGFDMGMIFANPPPAKPACMGNHIPQNMIFALKAKPLHGDGPMQVQNPYMGVDSCLSSNFELSGHQFGTILKSFAPTFQSAPIYPSPVEYCLGKRQETLF